MTLSDQQLDRYARHIVLRDIGGAGQSKLLSSHVLLIGAGGIGCPAIQYLAAAGVGTISVIDDDVVSLSNLQRQILYAESDIGTAKVDVAGAAVARLNPDVTFHGLKQRIDRSTAVDILKGVDVVIDGCDNFATRLIVNVSVPCRRKCRWLAPRLASFTGRLVHSPDGRIMRPVIAASSATRMTPMIATTAPHRASWGPCAG